ncbi:MAG: guanylate kinase [Hyphomicrobiaceae bacterium]|nr:guanylate kinase [Hyphomicrobiaceae bacterium]MCC0024686.1 guanylate kinase [Hyphomicrobiaceae bacterium]
MADSTRRGVMLVIASPSGAGKSSTTRRLLSENPNLSMSVSVTTRPKRDGEVEGTDYYFISVDEFRRMQSAGELLESAEVHGNFYGTPAAKVDELITAGRDIVFDIDYQGTQQLYEKRRADMVTVFLLPPSIPELKSRLETRALDTSEVISRRLQNARTEIDHWAEYDYVLVNHDLDETCRRVTAILEVATFDRTRQTNLSSLVRDLQSQIESI